MIFLDTTIDPSQVGIDTMWTLLAAALVFFMQAGFAMVEVGFTRAKNAANIIMKNLMDLSFGSLLFWLVGYGLMFGDDAGGFIGTSGFLASDNSVDGIPNLAMLIFQTVFAATAATIVSGAVAGRTKFGAYLMFSVVIIGLIYPISGHWAWGGGWLSEMGFRDFAGSTVVHSLGGWAGLMGAMIIGARRGKYVNGRINAIPGHNLVFGALGVFILWLGWFGFNPGTQVAAHGVGNAQAISLLFVTTNLAAAGGAVASMLVTWMRYKKPDVSIALNGALAGLVGITAGCDIVAPGGAIIIGVVCGIILPFSVDFIDRILKVDDPVGAISVHGVCGAIGTLMVGLLATEGGLFYGGGFALLGVQAIGVLAIGAWGIGTSFILFTVLKLTVGVRVSEEVETEGLDIHEHGQHAYND